MKTTSVTFIIVMTFGLSSSLANTNAQTGNQGAQSKTGLFASLKAFVNKPIETKPVEEMIKTDGTPLENCDGTVQRAVSECASPSGSQFRQATQLVSSIPSIATMFTSNADQLAEMCQMTALMGLVNGMMNGGQGQTCQKAANACQTACGKSASDLKKEADIAANAGDRSTYTFKMEQVKRVQQTEEECVTQVSQQMQLAQQQQQANAQPIAGMEACQTALNEDPEDEIVDCGLTRFEFYPECTTVSKLDAGNTTFESGVGISSNEPDVDLPDPEDREDYWNSLKNQGTGGQQGAGVGPGAGALGAGNRGGTSNGPPARNGKRRKSSSNLVSGGTATSGPNAGWSKSDEDNFNKRFAKLKGKDKNLKMLTPRRVGGRSLAGEEFALVTEDIWTRVYLRTNTRCTEQLTDCNANKSQNPYGVKSNTESL